MASASLMTEIVKGKSEAEARALFESFHDEMTGKSACHGAAAGELDKLTVLSGVREYPMRVKCATLSWHTLMAALDSVNRAVSTESDDRL
jgi:nitrogen fixation NifU-like protein